MTDDEVIALANADAAMAIEIARTSGDDPIVFITSNNHMPPLRAFGHAETVWQSDDNDDGDLFGLYGDTFEKALDAANVGLDANPDEGSLYVVDYARWERRDDADDSETLSGEYQPVTTCDACHVPEHDVCPLLPNCTCCADSIRKDA